MVYYDADTVYRFNPVCPRWVATAGVMAYCRDNECYWVQDVIASYVPKLRTMLGVDYLIVIEVKLNADTGGAWFTMACEDRRGPGVPVRRVLITQRIDYTTLTENLKFWAINDSPRGLYDDAARTTLMLPEEY